MFLDFIKLFFINKSLNRQLCNVKADALNCPIVNIGLIVDESHFAGGEELIKELKTIQNNTCSFHIISYRDDFKKKKQYVIPTFSFNDLNIKGEFTNQSINDFLVNEYDLLINYYNIEKPFLMLLTHRTSAKFKIGFSTIDKRLNHLLINTELQNPIGFTQEILKYLKILNKI